MIFDLVTTPTSVRHFLLILSVIRRRSTNIRSKAVSNSNFGWTDDRKGGYRRYDTLRSTHCSNETGRCTGEPVASIVSVSLDVLVSNSFNRNYAYIRIIKLQLSIIRCPSSILAIALNLQSTFYICACAQKSNASRKSNSSSCS